MYDSIDNHYDSIHELTAPAETTQQHSKVSCRVKHERSIHRTHRCDYDESKHNQNSMELVTSKTSAVHSQVTTPPPQTEIIYHEVEGGRKEEIHDKLFDNAMQNTHPSQVWGEKATAIEATYQQVGSGVAKREDIHTLSRGPLSTSEQDDNEYADPVMAIHQRETSVNQQNNHSSHYIDEHFYYTLDSFENEVPLSEKTSQVSRQAVLSSKVKDACISDTLSL